MKKLMLSSMLMLVAAAGRVHAQDASWASGDAAPVDGADTEVVKPADAVTGETDGEGGAEALFKVSTGRYFAMSSQVVKLAHGPAQYWQGCSSTALVRGGYGSDTRCGEAAFHPTFTRQMQSRFFMCAERAASKANIARPSRIFVRHDGSYNNRKARNSTRLSMHAYARALDIASFNLYDARGNVTKVSTNVRNYRGTTKVFYNEFRQCWKEAMPASCRPGMTEYKGSIGIPSSALGGNKLHNDHIHLSYAPCAG